MTNSSSVSYIVTMKKSMVDGHDKYFGEYKTKEKQRVLNFMRDKLLRDGTRVMLEGEELYSLKIMFSTDEIHNKETIESHYSKDVDFNTLSDEELFSYICGEYLLKGNMIFEGFGQIQTETY